MLLYSFLLPFLDRALLTTGLSAQQSKALGILLLFWAMHHLSSLAFPLRLSSDKAREKNKTAKLFPLLHTPVPAEGSLQYALAFFIYPSTSFLFWLRVVDIWSLTLEPSTFARKKGGSKTLILNPLYVYHNFFSFFSFSLSRIVDSDFRPRLSLRITCLNLWMFVGFLLLSVSFVRHRAFDARE